MNKINRFDLFKHKHTLQLFRDSTRGSFTVEAAAIMGTVLLVIFFVLFLGSYLHGKAYLTALAHEQAYTQRIQETPTLFGITDIQQSQSFEKKQSTVKLQGNCQAAFGGYMRTIQTEAEVKELYPVSVIRKLQAAKNIISG